MLFSEMQPAARKSCQDQPNNCKSSLPTACRSSSANRFISRPSLSAGLGKMGGCWSGFAAAAPPRFWGEGLGWVSAIGVASVGRRWRRRRRRRIFQQKDVCLQERPGCDVFRCMWCPKKSGNKRQPAITKLHNGTAWNAALLDSFIALISAGMFLLLMSQTNQYVCTCCVERGMFFTSYPTQASLLCAWWSTWASIELETWCSDAMLGEAGAAGPTPELRHQQPSP